MTGSHPNTYAYYSYTQSQPYVYILLVDFFNYLLWKWNGSLRKLHLRYAEQPVSVAA
jgi:hypothetical protein